MEWNEDNEEEDDDSDYIFEEVSDKTDEEYFENDAEPEELVEQEYQTFFIQQPVEIKKANYYVELLQISKDISKIGSSNFTMYHAIKEDLLNLKNKYVSNNKHGEVVEFVGKKRGRPKLKRYSKNSSIK